YGIAVGILLGRQRPFQSLEKGHEMNDLFRSEGAGHPPRWHRRVREDHARVVDLLIEVSVGKLPVGDGREVGADAPRGPDVVLRLPCASGIARLLQAGTFE